MSEDWDGVVGGPEGVPRASGESAAAPLEPMLGVGGLLRGAESGVTAAAPLWGRWLGIENHMAVLVA